MKMIQSISRFSVFFVFLASSWTVLAGPTGEQVVSGDITVTRPTSTATQVAQSTDKGIIHWQDFSIGANESVNFMQPGASSITLNRVTGINPSSILGQLTANGQIILINRAGVLFGANARVDVAGLIATTANITNQDFQAGLYRFNQEGTTPAGQILQQGKINAAPGGAVVLVAPNVTNEGLIAAKAGKVVLGSGSAYTVDLAGDQLLQFAVDPTQMSVVNAKGEAVPVGVYQAGEVFAEGGSVLLSTQAANQSINQVISHTGITEAKSLGTQNGEIVLSGGKGTTVQVSGQLIATGEGVGQKGGAIKVLGEKISVGTEANAQLNVAGQAGGGTILIGGNLQGKGPETNAQQVMVGNPAALNANATNNGDGGTIVAYSEGTTVFHGTAEAKGGLNGGHGGMIETSGHYLDVNGATINAGASKGNPGTWLLDPLNVLVQDRLYTSDILGTDSDDRYASFITPITIQNALKNGNVVITTVGAGAQSGNIKINSPIATEEAADNASLKLMASKDLDILASIVGNFGLDIDVVGSINPTAKIDVTNFNLERGTWIQLTGNGFNSLPMFNVRNDFRINGGIFKRLSITRDGMNEIGDVYGLQGMNHATLLSGSYTLTRNIDAGVTVNWNDGNGFIPIGNMTTPFSGIFDGKSLSITNLYIKRDTSNEVGLFGAVRNATINNLGVEGDVKGQDNVGLLAGHVERSSITGVGSSGKVTGSNTLGGLIGYLDEMSTLSKAYNTAFVENIGMGGSSVTETGGLVGHNEGNISQSYNAGRVQGSQDGMAGGLIGNNNRANDDNSGKVNETYNVGLVVGVSSSQRGGLIGKNTGDVQNSYWINDLPGNDGIAGIGDQQGTIDAVTSSGGKTTQQLRNPQTYTSWPFYSPVSTSGVWVMAGYPHLITERRYDITNATQLQLMLVDAGSSKAYTLANDIDMSDTRTWNWNGSEYLGFMPIGNDVIAFNGSLNGNGYKISHLYINDPTAAPTDTSVNSGMGLFGHIENATIKNLNLEDFYFKGAHNMGGLVGVMEGEDSHITDSNAIGVIINNNTGSVFQMGGLVGYLKDGRIENSRADVDITLTNLNEAQSVGGFIGKLKSGLVKQSQSKGDILANQVSSLTKAGGFIGEMLSGNIQSSSSSGQIDLRTDTQHPYVTQSHLGGFIGQMLCGTLKDSYSSGNIALYGEGEAVKNLGGLIGYLLNGNISRVYAKGDVTVGFPGASAVGGLVGLMESGHIANAYSTGNITTGANSSKVGGAIGALKGGTVTNLYSIGHVTADNSNHVGGFAGSSSGTITDSYWNTETSGYTQGLGTGSSSGLVGKRTHDMQLPSTYINWPIFQITPAAGLVWSWYAGDYPRLYWEVDPAMYHYNITNALELQMMYKDLAGSYQLMNDIDASVTKNWHCDEGDACFGFKPIGSSDSALNSKGAFTGTLKGNGYQIRGLVINRPEESGVGLFGATNGATISHLKLTNDSNQTGYIKGLRNVGSLVGIGKDTTISNVINYLPVSSVGGYIGGLAGILGKLSVTPEDELVTTIDGGRLSHSYNYGLVSTSYTAQYIGGLVGLSASTIANSHNHGKVQVVGSGSNMIGGITGTNMGVISESSNQGEVGVGISGSRIGGLVGVNFGDISYSFNSAPLRTSPNSQHIGGIVGHHAAGTIQNSYNTGAINLIAAGGAEEMNQIAGGIAGVTDSSSLIMNSFSNASITWSGITLMVGGLIGSHSGIMKNSYHIGSISGSSSGFYIGGVVGINSQEGVIAKTYHVGNMLARENSQYIGAFAGNNEGIIGQSFFDASTVGASLPNVGYAGDGAISDIQGLDTHQMMTKTPYIAFDQVADQWNFASDWGIDVNQTYPYIKALGIKYPDNHHGGGDTTQPATDSSKLFPEKQKAETVNGVNNTCKGLNALSWGCLKMNFLH